MISPRKSHRSSCFFLSVISLGGWLSFKPTFVAQLALEVPRPAFRGLSPSITYIDRRSASVRVRFRFVWVLAADRRRFFRQCSDNDPRSTLSTREAKNRQFSAQTVRLEPWSSGHYRLLSRPGQAWEVLRVALRWVHCLTRHKRAMSHSHIHVDIHVDLHDWYTCTCISVGVTSNGTRLVFFAPCFGPGSDCVWEWLSL